MDIIGELLRANMLQQVGDDSNRVDRLRSAAAALADTLSSGEPGRLPTALLCAVDSTNHAKAPMIRMSRGALLEVWETLGNAFPDEPIELYRAVLLEAAAKAFTASEASAAAGWYTLRSALQLLQTGRWDPVIRQMLEEWDDATGAAAERAWAINLERPSGIPPAHAGRTTRKQRKQQGKDGREGQEEEAAQEIPSAASKLADKILNAGTGYYNETFTTALRKNLRTLLDSVSEDMRATAEEVLREAAGRMEETAQTVLRESREGLEEVQRTARAVGQRTELLWWRSTGYSSSRRRRYSELAPAQAVIAAALDMHHMADAVTPASVEHVMFDTVATAVEGTVCLNDLADCAWSAELAKGLEPADGTFLCAVTLGIVTPLASRDHQLPAAEAAVLLFRDLQAARLLAGQGAP